MRWPFGKSLHEFVVILVNGSVPSIEQCFRAAAFIQFSLHTAAETFLRGGIIRQFTKICRSFRLRLRLRRDKDGVGKFMGSGFLQIGQPCGAF
jgi:hypothetical protein